MSQILNIFRKDTRRFWPEILLSVVITAAFALIYPVQWLPGAGERVRDLRILADVLTGLVPVGWWLLIGRVVHAETLVGDRQVLFLLVWLYLPFLAAQSLLLVEAGFQPLSYFPGLLFGLLLATGILVMPLFAIAAVTANFARLTLTLLGGLIVLLGAAFAASFWDRSSAIFPSSDRTSLPVVICLCAAAILLQYAARRVWPARVLLIAGPVVFAAIVFAVSRSENSLVNRYYPPPASASAAPFQLQLALDSNRVVTNDNWERRGERFIDVPMRLAGVASGYAIDIDNVKATFTAADGFSWTSSWQGTYGDRYLPDSDKVDLHIGIDSTVYQRLKGTQAKLHLSLALTRLRAGATTSIVLPTGNVELPGFGICSAHPDFAFESYQPGEDLDCRSALHQPQLTYLSTVWQDEPCSASQPTPEHTALADGWTGNLNPNPAEFGITSVWTPFVNFNRRDHNGMPDSSSKWRLCPGAPLRATQYYLVDRTQMEFTLPEVQLPGTQVPGVVTLVPKS